MQVDGLSDDPLATRFYAVLLRLVKGSQHQAMTVTANFDLTFTQLRLLYILDHAGAPQPVSALGEAADLSVAAAGRAVDALHRSGLVSRNEDPDDRRVKRIALSPDGAQALEQITRARFAAVQDFVAALSEQERTALDHAVTTLADLAELHLPGFAGCPAGTTPPSTTQETAA